EDEELHEEAAVHRLPLALFLPPVLVHVDRREAGRFRLAGGVRLVHGLIVPRSPADFTLGRSAFRTDEKSPIGATERWHLVHDRYGPTRGSGNMRRGRRWATSPGHRRGAPCDPLATEPALRRPRRFLPLPLLD